MEKKGLCTTCVQVRSCIFTKNPPVWECEEFFSGNHAPTSFSSVKASRVALREVETESE